MKKLTRRQRQQVYRQAAANILKGSNFYSCIAIESAAHSIWCSDRFTKLRTRPVYIGSEQHTQLLDEYALFFKPEYALSSDPWWDSTDIKSQEERALALLFMAEIT